MCATRVSVYVCVCRRPYVDEFRWRVTDWHYRFWMGPTAHRALRKYQGGSDQLQYLLDGIAAGTKSAKYKCGCAYAKRMLDRVVCLWSSSCVCACVQRRLGGFTFVQHCPRWCRT